MDRGAWGDRFEYEGDQFDPCIEGDDDEFMHAADALGSAVIVGDGVAEAARKLADQVKR